MSFVNMLGMRRAYGKSGVHSSVNIFVRMCFLSKIKEDGQFLYIIIPFKKKNGYGSSMEREKNIKFWCSTKNMIFGSCLLISFSVTTI